MLPTDQLLCLFSARVDERGDSYVFEVPKSEVEHGAVRPDEVYRVGLFPAVTADADETTDADATARPDPEQSRSEAATAVPSSSLSRPASGSAADQPPVSEGEVRPVEIEDLGDQGDGLARIGPGYVVFVPDTDVGDRVRVRVTDVRENFAFAEVVA